MRVKIGQNILHALDSNIAIEVLNQSKLIFEIGRNDAELGSTYQQFVQDYEAYLFVKQDFELKSKLADIWEIQCKSLKQKATNSFNALKTLVEQKKLAVADLDEELL